MHTLTVSAHVDSLPIDRKVKKYLIMKYNWLVRHNGEPYAVEIFKAAKTVIMQYRSDPDRCQRRSTYMSQFPMRNRKMVRKLFAYADTDPHSVVDLLKLYTEVERPTESKEHAFKKLKGNLEDITLPTQYEDFEIGLLSIFPDYRSAKRAVDRYHFWKRRFRHDLEDWGKEEHKVPLPFPQQFVDYGRNINWETVSFMRSVLRNCSPEERLLLRDVIRSNEGRSDPVFSELTTELSRNLFDAPAISPVGKVLFKPKVGTTDWRPVAAPNLWWQALSAPFADFLYRELRKLSKTDSTFDQNRFVQEIESRLQKKEYVGCVDLHAATDYLPRVWFNQLLQSVDSQSSRVSMLASDVLMRGQWSVEGQTGSTVVSWQQGQPLGAKSSFAILGLTHNMILDCLAFGLGLRDHPFRITGDDLIVYDRHLRETYIAFMEMCGIPLTLSKSYEINSVEFLGRWYVAGQGGRYITDHHRIFTSNLFDYSVATGKPVRWEHLPQGCRHFWSKGFACEQDAVHAYYGTLAWLYTGRQNVPGWISHYIPFIAPMESSYAQTCKLNPEPIDTGYWYWDPSLGLVRLDNHMTTLRSPSSWRR